MTHGTVALGGEARSADRLAQWVQRRESVIAHDATNSIWHQVPAYGDRADAGLRDEVEAHCRQVFAAFLASVTDRRHPLRSDFPWSGQHAMRRVELGITLSDFMKAFRVGQLTLWDDILAGVNEWPSTKDAALLLVSQVMRTIEVGSTAAAEAYLEAQQYQLADSARLARDLLEDLLASSRWPRWAWPTTCPSSPSWRPCPPSSSGCSSGPGCERRSRCRDAAWSWRVTTRWSPCCRWARTVRPGWWTASGRRWSRSSPTAS
jgi:hypothetical protein